MRMCALTAGRPVGCVSRAKGSRRKLPVLLLHGSAQHTNNSYRLCMARKRCRVPSCQCRRAAWGTAVHTLHCRPINNEQCCNYLCIALCDLPRPAIHAYACC
eukprot:365032-Chlamydomonas_euryale.AAC.2